jgi:hypothetical protein
LHFLCFDSGNGVSQWLLDDQEQALAAKVTIIH